MVFAAAFCFCGCVFFGAGAASPPRRVIPNRAGDGAPTRVISVAE